MIQLILKYLTKCILIAIPNWSIKHDHYAFDAVIIDFNTWSTSPYKYYNYRIRINKHLYVLNKNSERVFRLSKSYQFVNII